MDSEEVWTGTFHAFAAAVLRTHGKVLGWDSVTVLSHTDQLSLLQRCLCDLHGFSMGEKGVSMILQQISVWKSSHLQPEDLRPNTFLTQVEAKAYEAYWHYRDRLLSLQVTNDR